MTYFSGITVVSGQAISVTKLKELENELQADSCTISSTGQGQPEQRKKMWRQRAGRRSSG